jgi:hypothetical protein
MIPKSGDRLPACAKPWHAWSFRLDASAGEGRSEKIMLSPALEHFPEKWSPVFRQKMRPLKKIRTLSDSIESESALMLA